MTRHLAPSLVLVAAIAACGGSPPDLSQYDPRCRSACTIEVPSLDGYGDVCNADSQVACLDECEARIAGTETLCGSCLVEESCFAPGGCDDSPGNPCFVGEETTVTGWNGSCTYTCADAAEYEACLRQVSPRREVACPAEFRPVAECQASCG